MKSLVLLLICTFLAVMPAVAGNLSNLTVNGSFPNFNMTSGDAIRWEYDVDSGGTVICDFWFDHDSNGVIDPGVDRSFAFFTQTDGQMENNGPPDLDGEVNGHVYFEMPVGLAPAHYILHFIRDNDTLAAYGHVESLVNPTHTVSGQVAVPSGFSAKNVYVEMEHSGEGDGGFWGALTDENGLFTVALHVDSAESHWRLRMRSSLGANVVTPQEYELTVTGNHLGYDFGFLQAAAQVAGVVKDEAGNPMPDRGVSIWGNNGSVQRWVNTDRWGGFQLGLLADELGAGPYNLSVHGNSDETTTHLRAVRTINSLNNGDSLYHELVVYSTNSTIEGTATLNGNPAGYRMKIIARIDDLLEADVWCDSVTGNFSIPVSDQFSTYQVFATSLPLGYFCDPVPAAPGATGVVLNASNVSSVNDNTIGKPLTFALHQNYPNPFNPLTVISYQLPVTGYVSLKIFNVLGQEVTTLVNEMKNPGVHQVQWDAGRYPSGVYYYKLQSGSFTDIKKMIMLK